MTSKPKQDLGRAELAAIIVGLLVAVAAVTVLVWSLASVFLPHDLHIPLTKAGGLKTEQIK